MPMLSVFINPAVAAEVPVIHEVNRHVGSAFEELGPEARTVGGALALAHQQVSARLQALPAEDLEAREGVGVVLAYLNGRCLGAGRRWDEIRSLLPGFAPLFGRPGLVECARSPGAPSLKALVALMGTGGLAAPDGYRQLAAALRGLKRDDLAQLVEAEPARRPPPDGVTVWAALGVLDGLADDPAAARRPVPAAPLDRAFLHALRERCLRPD